MTPQEMIIGVNLELQKINSNSNSSFQDEEIEWFLYDETLRFIKTRMRPDLLKGVGFQDDEKRYDDLENLITPVSLPAYVDAGGDCIFAYLPYDYMHRINDRSLTKDLCGATYNPTVANTSFYTAKYLLPSIALSTYSSLQIFINSVGYFFATDYFPSGLPDALAKFQLMNYIQEVTNKLTITNPPVSKYEKFMGQYQSGSLIVESSVAFTLAHSYTGSGGTIQFPITQTQLSTVSAITGAKEVPNRLTKTDLLHDIRRSSIANTKHYSPLSDINDGKIRVWHDKKFIVSGIKMDYIRRPKKISVTLNQGCELNENVHPEIVVNTAKRLAGITRSEIYQNLAIENNLKE
jgi:hypothetical protein